MPEPYAVRWTGGKRVAYKNKKAYLGGVAQSHNTRQHRNRAINRRVGGRIVS